MFASVTPRSELRVFTTLVVALALWTFILLYKHRQAVASNYELGLINYYPISLKNVLLVPEDPTHYRIYGDGGEDEWDAQFPPGRGRIQLAPDNQTYEVTMFHELRCLGAIRHAMATQSVGSTSNANMLHECFNYLRELILCRADTTLEAVLNTDLSVNHAYPHICRDWSALYSALKSENEPSG